MKNFNEAQSKVAKKSNCDLDEFMVKVSDNWYGNYEGNKIRIALYFCYLDNEYRLVACGNDDFMIELNGDTTENELKISEIFDYLKNNPNQIYNQQWFLDKGMFID